MSASTIQARATEKQAMMMEFMGIEGHLP